MTHTTRPIRRAWVPALFWLAVIAWESTPLGSAEHTFAIILPVLSFLFPHWSTARDLRAHGLLRKAGHYIGYGILSLVMFRAWWATVVLPRAAQALPSWRAMWSCWRMRAAALAMLSTVAVAALDEWHQTMLPGRTGSLRDVILDSAAGVCAQMLIVAVSDVRRLRSDGGAAPARSG